MKRRLAVVQKKSVGLRTLVATRQVGGDSGTPCRGFLFAGPLMLPCALGRTGVAHLKREGDGKSPAGRFQIVEIRFRPDRIRRPKVHLGARLLRQTDVWCDDPESRLYNRAGHSPCADRHEELWRRDHVYDVIVILDHNQHPRVRGAGSAIFFHLLADEPGPTAGCVAISAAHMRRLLPRLARNATLTIR